MTEINVVRVDVHDDESCRRAYDVVRASQRHERPWFESSSLPEMLADWRHQDPAERFEMYAATDANTTLGVLRLWFPDQDNTDKAWLFLDVTPDQRNHGVGAALVQQAVERARAEQRREVIGEYYVPVEADEDHPYVRFATKNGFDRSNTEIMRHLDLPVPEQRLDRLFEQTRPHWEAAYRLETHVDGVPEHLQPSLCEGYNQLAVDAPTGDIDYEAESLNPERYQSYLELEREQGRHRVTTVAVDAAGQVVAYTDLMLPAGAPSHAWQWGTLVRREHRGHRLGMALKVANLRRLQADYPQRTVIRTGNDGTNDFMVSINVALGFEVVEHVVACHRLLA